MEHHGTPWNTIAFNRSTELGSPGISHPTTRNPAKRLKTPNDICYVSVGLCVFVSLSLCLAVPLCLCLSASLCFYVCLLGLVWSSLSVCVCWLCLAVCLSLSLHKNSRRSEKLFRLGSREKLLNNPYALLLTDEALASVVGHRSPA